MTFQPGANLYTLAFGTRPENVEVPHYDTRAPTTSDILYPIGKRWLYVGQSIWELLSISTVANVTTANWVQLADSDGSVQAVLGTANQITATNVAGTVTLSLPAAIITPGSLSTTTTLTAGTGLVVTSGGAAVTGTTTINTTGAAVTTIGTGGTGAVNIGNATGNTAVTGSLTTTTSLAATTTVTAGTGLIVTSGGAAVTGTTTINTSGAADTTIGTGGTGAVNIGNATGNTAVTGTLTSTAGITASTGNIVATAGAVNAGTSMTATLGDITATDGNVIINGAARQLRVHGGAVTDFIGTATLAAGTTGAILNTNIAATDRIFIERTSINGSTALGVFSYTISAGASFTITALNPTDATTQTNDTSIVTYFIVRQV